MTAPQDVILSEWFQRLQNSCLQHILKQSTPSPTKPKACVWLVWTFLAALLNRNTYACCLFPSPPPSTPPKKGFHCTLNHGGLTKNKLLIPSHLQQSFINECFIITTPISPHRHWSQSSGTVPIGRVSWNTKFPSPVKCNKHLQSNIWTSSSDWASTISIRKKYINPEINTTSLTLKEYKHPWRAQERACGEGSRSDGINRYRKRSLLAKNQPKLFQNVPVCEQPHAWRWLPDVRASYCFVWALTFVKRPMLRNHSFASLNWDKSNLERCYGYLIFYQIAEMRTACSLAGLVLWL